MVTNWGNMADSQPRKRARIKGIYQVKKAVSVRVLESGQKKPRQELWNMSEEDEFSQRFSKHSLLTQPGPSSRDIDQNVPSNSAFTPIQVPDDGTTLTTTKKETNYTKYRKKRAVKWNELRPLFAHALVEENSPASLECFICGEESSDEIVRCLDCGPLAFFCPDCCIMQHRCIILHQPELWKDGQFIQFVLPRDSWKRPGHECGQDYTKPILLLDMKGCPHFQMFHFCKCEEEAVTLVRLGFWPSTPLTPSTAISMQLLASLRSLVFTGHLSISAFTSSLRHRFEAQYSKHPNICQVFTWEMVLNFNLVYHKISSLEEVCPDLMPTETCPACPKDQKIIAMDGNFSMVRRRRTGSLLEDGERHQNRFFFPQKEVDDFVEKYNTASKGVKENQQCSNFQAGSIIRSKNKNEKLEVKGIFGSVCRHDYPFRFFDLKHGERLAYPVFLFNNIKEQTRLLLYDIACQMETHLKNRIQMPENLVFGVPIFHVYGHKMHCQVLYSPRRIKDAGLCDGEGTERLWSYMGDFSSITKEMTAENRHDLITELLLHYSTKLTNQMANSLRQKMEKACLILASTESEILEMIENFPGHISREDIHKWSNAEKERMQKKKKKVPVTEDWKESYAVLLHDFNVKSEKMDEVGLSEEELDENAMEQGRLDGKLRRIEKKQKFRRWEKGSHEYEVHVAAALAKQRMCCLLEVRDDVVEYVYHCYIRRKYSQGQSSAKRVTTQLLASSKRVNSSLQRYNSIPSFTAESQKLTREEAVKLESPVYLQILDPESQDMDPQIPASAKRKAIDVLNLNTRAREEINMVCQDVSVFKASILQREEILQRKVEEIHGKEYLDSYEVGCVALIKKALGALSTIKNEVETYFSQILIHEQLNVGAFLNHVHNLDGSDCEDFDMDKEQLHAILQEIAQFEREAEEQENEEQVDRDLHDTL